MVILRDTTERKEAEEALSRCEGQLRALAARLQRVREEEAIRIAGELHDQLGRCLTFFGFLNPLAIRPSDNYLFELAAQPGGHKGEPDKKAGAEPKISSPSPRMNGLLNEHSASRARIPENLTTLAAYPVKKNAGYFLRGVPSSPANGSKK
jgi:hypothetical protein